MPTGYTADIANDISFEQFVWRCARGMGALIMMRDDPYDAPVPEEFKPSTYNAEALKEAQARLTALRSMTPEQVKVAAEEAYVAEIERWNEHRDEKQSLRKKYDAMLAKVRAWEPPLDGSHRVQGFHDFANHGINRFRLLHEIRRQARTDGPEGLARS